MSKRLESPFSVGATHDAMRGGGRIDAKPLGRNVEGLRIQRCWGAPCHPRWPRLRDFRVIGWSCQTLGSPLDWLVSRIDLLFQHCWKIPLSTTTVVPPVECPHERRLDRVAEAEDGKIRMGRRGWAIEVFPKPKGPHKTQRSYSPQNLFFCSI